MKKLYRIENEKKIAGICAGIGDMFDIDPTIVRLIFIFACILTQVWPLVFAYIIGWLIIPEISYKKDADKYTA